MMRTTRTALLLAVGTLVAAGITAGAQEVRVTRPGGVYVSSFGGASGAKLGLGVGSGSARDTLGLLVTSIVPDGPAEQAGLIEGDRLVAINGVPLALSAADAGEPDMSSILRRRLERELAKVDSGGEVTLRVWSGGRTREVKLRVTDEPRGTFTYGTAIASSRFNRSDRPVLGLSLSATGSKRDTLGVFVSSVVAGGPAERAGIIEGHRIASINGVDLRVSAVDAGDVEVASTKSSRLAREIESVEPGARVQLRVWSDGRYRDVTVEAARASEVYKDDAAAMRFHGGAVHIGAPDVIIRSMPSIAPFGPSRRESLDSLWRRRDELRRSVDPRRGGDSTDTYFYMPRINEQIRETLERARQQMDRVRRVMPGLHIITT